MFTSPKQLDNLGTIISRLLPRSSPGSGSHLTPTSLMPMWLRHYQRYALMPTDDTTVTGNTDFEKRPAEQSTDPG